MEGGNYTYYKNFDWGEEISNSIKVWLLVCVSLCYCYFATKFVPKGGIRLCLFTPIVCLFTFLPLNIHSMHIGGISSFFIAWLANFKVLLLSFGLGPLSDPFLSLPHFVAIGCFPIQVRKTGCKITETPRTSFWNYALKGALVPLFVKAYDYSDEIHPKAIMVVYCLHVYFVLEVTLATVAALVRAALGLELEPQFHAPYLSTSLQDFWGRRWNLMVTRILRTSVYAPALRLWAGACGRERAPLPAILTTFSVSALMHELIFYYLGRTWPTWEITWFFLLHGASLACEIVIKKAVGDRWQLPRAVSTTLTVGFVVGTGFWLFFPQLMRCKADVKAFEEYAVLGAYVKGLFVGGTVQMNMNMNMTRASLVS